MNVPPVERIGAAARAVPGVLSVEKLRVRAFGAGYFVDAHVQADPLMSLGCSRPERAAKGAIRVGVAARVRRLYPPGAVRAAGAPARPGQIRCRPFSQSPHMPVHSPAVIGSRVCDGRMSKFTVSSGMRELWRNISPRIPRVQADQWSRSELSISTARDHPSGSFAFRSAHEAFDRYGIR